MTTRLICGLAVACLAADADARTWTDDTGRYTIEAELVAFDGQRVVLKRDSDGELGMVDLERLSDEDEKYVAEQRDAASQIGDGETQLWTLRDGLEVPGQVVDYTRREVTVQRRRGDVYVNDRQFDNLPAVYQKIVPLVVGEQTGTRVNDAESLESWLVRQKGRPQTFTVDGVVMEFASGDEYAVPFFLFGEAAQRLLAPGWDAWLAANGASESDYDRRSELALALQTRASQRDAVEAEKLRIAKLQLGMAAVDAGVTDLWEVSLYPQAGVAGSPQWVVVPGRDSRVAMQTAVARYPGYVAGATRRLSR